MYVLTFKGHYSGPGFAAPIAGLNNRIGGKTLGSAAFPQQAGQFSSRNDNRNRNFNLMELYYFSPILSFVFYFIYLHFFILFCFVLYVILLHFILFYFILFYFILSFYILLNFIKSIIFIRFNYILLYLLYFIE